MANQLSRTYQNLVVPAKQPLPDPLYGLSAFERQRVLLMRPTWAERHRMCIPGQSKEERLDTLLDILFERRHAYDIEFHARCKQVELERANNRYLYNEQHLTQFKPAITSALTAVHAQRREQDQREHSIRDAYFRRRAEQQPSPMNQKRGRRKSMGMSR
jgi:hypothetical protein